MIIPRTQGRTVSQPTLQQHAPMTGLSAIGDTLQAHQDKLDAEQKKKDNLTASTIVSQFGLDAENLGADYRQKVASGQMSDTDADLEFSKEYATRMDEVVAQLPKSVSQDYKDGLMKYGTGQVSTFYQTGRNVASDLAKTNLKLTLENAAKMQDQQAAAPIVENAFTSAADYLSPAEVLEYKSGYQQQQQSNNLGLRLSKAQTEKEYQDIYNELQDENNYSSLPSSTRSSAIHSAQSGVLRIQKQQQREQNQKESTAAELANDLQSNILSGGKIDLDYLSNVEKATEGTAAYKDVQFLKANYVGIQEFIGMNTNEKKARLDKLERDFKNNPSENAADRKKLLDLHRTIYSQSLSDAKSDNVATAGNLGIEVKGFTGQQLLNDPSGVMNTIVQNIHALNYAKTKEPNINLDPIPDLHKDDIQSSFEKANAKKKLDVLASVMKVAHQNKLSLNATQGIIRSIGGGDGIYNVAAVAVANNANYNGKSTGYIILSGDSLIKAGNQITPTSLETEFRSEISNLSGEGDYSANWSAFKAAYAYFEAEAGHQQNSKVEMVDSDSMDKALNAVLGGVYQQHNTSWIGTAKFKTTYGDVKDWKVQKPYLMSDEGFETAINSGFEQVAKKHNMNPDFLKNNFRLQAVSGSTFDQTVAYYLLDANNERWVVKGKNGKKDKYQLITVTNKRR